MSEPKTVYAYVDLAEEHPYAEGGFYVPCSDGIAYRTWAAKRDELDLWTPVRGWLAVRGAEALRVAEREVIEATRELRPQFAHLDIVHVEKESDGLVVIRWSDGGGSAVPVESRVYRAVDIRDRLRSKLASLRSDARERMGFGIDWASAPSATVASSMDSSGKIVFDPCGACGHGKHDHRGACIIVSCPCEVWIPTLQTITVNLDTSAAVASLNEVKALAEDVGKRVSESLKPKEEPMPVVNYRSDDPRFVPKPDPHDKCRIHIVDGKLYDDYGRPIDGVYRFDGIWPNPKTLRSDGVAMHVKLSRDAIETGGRPAAQPDPIYVEIDKPVATSERERICAEIQAKTNRPVVMLAYGLRRAAPPVEPEERQRSADIDRRADLGNAYRSGKRVGLTLGIGGSVIAFLVSMGLVGFFRPEWMIKLGMWLASGR